VDLATNVPYQVVAQLDPVTAKTMTVWVNPSSSSDRSVVSVDVPIVTAPINGFSFRQASGFGNFFAIITNLDLATTYDEAATNVVSNTNNLATPVFAYQPPAVTSNFVNSSVSIQALAYGPGLANMTYQWQKSANAGNTSPQNVSNSNGNSNQLSIVSAQVADTGYYTLVAITPSGLSTTSSVARIVITATPAPPSFTVQPASSTIYSGQSIIFSATVVTPGNPTFTWYSNNTVVSVGQVDSGTTSTLELDNVTTNYSANYRVAVTNDVFPTGVVSTNAVLSVINPPGVSIAFLRQLVDPNNNYQSTNSTQPYSITGVITTFTNLTSGNTTSYYLQDGTAGINIFATFGSTFRPQEGDIVTFVGVMSSFSSGLELFADTTTRPYTSYTDLGPGTLPAPVVVPFAITNTGYANMNTNVAGRYVQLTNVFFGANAGTTISSGFVTVSDVNGQQFNLWFSSQDPDTVGQILPTFAKSVTGVMFGGMNPSAPVGGVPSPNFAVAVTRFADIVLPPPAPIPLTATFGTGGAITFNWTDASFTLQTTTNLLGPWTAVTGATDGFMTNVTSDPAIFYRLFHP
jgi:hypothetical protein